MQGLSLGFSLLYEAKHATGGECNGAENGELNGNGDYTGAYIGILVRGSLNHIPM